MSSKDLDEVLRDAYEKSIIEIKEAVGSAVEESIDKLTDGITNSITEADKHWSSLKPLEAEIKTSIDSLQKCIDSIMNSTTDLSKSSDSVVAEVGSLTAALEERADQLQERANELNGKTRALIQGVLDDNIRLEKSIVTSVNEYSAKITQDLSGAIIEKIMDALCNQQMKYEIISKKRFILLIVVLSVSLAISAVGFLTSQNVITW